MAQGPNGRFVPSGVNAESWLGFEQRIEERRFRALLDTMNQALEAGDVVEARVALEEARDLRPEAPELTHVEERLASLPLPQPLSSRDQWMGSRTLSAVMLLLLGITLLMGIEWMRSSDQAPQPATIPVAAPADLLASPLRVSPSPPPGPVTIVPAPDADTLEPAPVGTGGLERADRPRPAAALPQPTFRPASTGETSLLHNGEVPDDFVFVPSPQPRSEPAADSRPIVARPDVAAAFDRRGAADVPGRAAASGVSRETSSDAPSGFSDLNVASDFSRTIAPDETRVAAVLDEYARAYGELDAGAAREVWPTVDERALARAFAGLASQDVAFDACDIDVDGAVANASCRGRASYVGKIGSGELRTESRTWRFELRRDGEAWKIANAEARQQ